MMKRTVRACLLLMPLIVGLARVSPAGISRSTSIRGQGRPGYESNTYVTLSVQSGNYPFYEPPWLGQICARTGTEFALSMSYTLDPNFELIGVDGITADGRNIGLSGSYTFAPTGYNVGYIVAVVRFRFKGNENIEGMSAICHIERPQAIGQVREAGRPTLSERYMSGLYYIDEQTNQDNVFDGLKLPIRVVAPHPDNPEDTIVRVGVQARALIMGTDLVTAWRDTNSSGIAEVTFGDGSTTLPILTNQYFSPDFYIAATPCTSGTAPVVSTAYIGKILTFQGKNDFSGALNVTVKDMDGNPLRAAVAAWGGPMMLSNERNALTDSSGNATLNIAPWLNGTQQWSANVTLAPRVVIRANRTQLIDEPGQMFVAKWPVLLSPEFWLDPGAYSYVNPSRRAELIILDEANAEVGRVNRPIYSGARLTDTDRWRTRHRLYFPVQATATPRRYRVVARYEDWDQGRRTEDIDAGMSNYEVPVQLYREPLKPQFRFEYVVCRVGAWSYASTSQPLTAFMPAAYQAVLSSGIENYFPGNLTFSVNSNWSPPTGASTVFSFNSSHLNALARQLGAYARLNDIDLAMGIVPPGYLHTHSLFTQGGAAGLQFNDVPNAILLDLTLTAPHHGLHEFMHTLGLDDDDWETLFDYPSANGYDPVQNRDILNLPNLASPPYPQSQSIMYDGANSPWFTVNEYSTLMNYATRRITYIGPQGEMLKAADPPSSPDIPVMLIAGEFTGTPATPKVTVNPIFTEMGQIYNPREPFGYGDYYIRLISNSNATIAKGYFNRFNENPDERGDPYGQIWDSQKMAGFFFQLPWRDDLKEIHFGASNVYGQFSTIWKILTPSAHAPVVAFEGPPPGPLSGKATIRWQASDADVEYFYTWLLCSPDGGATWQTISNNIGYIWGSSAYQHTINCADYPTGDQYKFKILVSDGIRTGSAISTGVYSLQGYDPSPAVQLSRASFQASGNPPLNFALPLNIRNSGRSNLNIRLDETSLPVWMQGKGNATSTTLIPGEGSLLLLNGELESTGTYSGNLRLLTNAPASPVVQVPIRMDINSGRYAPVVEWLDSQPELIPDWPFYIGTTNTLTFRAFEMIGRTGLDARITISRLTPPEIIINRAPMSANGQPGQYSYDWTPPATLPEGYYGVDVAMSDPQSGLSDSDGWKSGLDMVCLLARPNRLPVFTAPTTDPTTVTGTLGEELVLNYQVSDPDGDRVELGIYGFNFPVRWDQQAGQIRWIPDSSDRHDLYLTARDEHQAMRTLHYVLQVGVPNGGQWPERAYAFSTRDGSVLPWGPAEIGAVTWVEGQRGCRLEYRKIGATAWTGAGQVAYAPFIWGMYLATWTLDVTKLEGYSEYEVRFININAAGVEDPNPSHIHLFTPGLGGDVIGVAAPPLVTAGTSFSIEVTVRNVSTSTWTPASSVRIGAVDGIDPFTPNAFVGLAPGTQVPRHGLVTFVVNAAAPPTTGTYTTCWQLQVDNTFIGAIGQATIVVHPPLTVNQPEITDYLLEKTNPSADWVRRADLNMDGRIDAADLLMGRRLLEFLYGE